VIVCGGKPIQVGERVQGRSIPHGDGRICQADARATICGDMPRRTIRNLIGRREKVDTRRPAVPAYNWAHPTNDRTIGKSLCSWTLFSRSSRRPESSVHPKREGRFDMARWRNWQPPSGRPSYGSISTARAGSRATAFDEFLKEGAEAGGG